MATALKGQTVSGEAEAKSITVRATIPFSWLKTSTASPMSFQPRSATLSNIQFGDAAGGSLENVGEKFMETVFEELVDEQVAIVPSADLSQYFVVHVTNRFPTPDIGEDSLRNRFGNEGKQFAFAQSEFHNLMQQQIASPVIREWQLAVWKRYGIDPEAEE